MANGRPAAEAPQLLFVSKPLVPPWHDGSKNLTRDLARHVTAVRPVVMTTVDAPLSGVQSRSVYASGGGFAPGLRANANVFLHLIKPDASDGWHFVFAPNLRSAQAARLALRLRRAQGWRGRVIQTIASTPRSFEHVERSLFGDHLIVLSTWMRERLLKAGVQTPMDVIPPCVPDVRTLERHAAKAKFGFGERPVVLYPGDYEVSSAPITLARAAKRLTSQGATVVFACRPKTPRAHEAQQLVQAELDSYGVPREHVRHLGQVPDMAELLAASDVIAFPVDDLYGKVDLPLVLLEALSLGLPLIVAEGSPPAEIETSVSVEPGSAAALADAVEHALAESGSGAVSRRQAYLRRYTPEVMARAYDALYQQIL